MADTFTVERAVMNIQNEERTIFLILKDGLPVTSINKHLVVNQCKKARPASATVYRTCVFMNYLGSMGLSFETAALDTVYDFLCWLFVEEAKSYTTIMAYITELAALYTSLILQGFAIDPTIRILKPDELVVKSRKGQLTMIPCLRTEFIPKKTRNRRESQYTKWYTREQLEAISAELPLVHRCIFWDTVLTGHRIDSALSVTMDTLDLRNSYISPTRTKTGKMHVSLMPQKLHEMIESYVLTERPNIVGRTGSSSPYLFLGRDGNPITYHAYIHALSRAGDKAMQKNPNLHIDCLHSHAGRSTFAATLRTYQLQQRRAGITTFSDADFCNLMDWKSLECLENYDIVTRVQEVSPLLGDFYQEFDQIICTSPYSVFRATT